MSQTPVALARRALIAAALFMSGAAYAQSPEPAPQTTPKPSAEVAAKAQEDTDALRIRGLVEKVDDSGVVVQLSKGITIRVDIGPQAIVYSAARIAIADMKVGENLAVRARAGQAAGETTSALEVLGLSVTPAPVFPGLGVNGVLKGIDRTGENVVLVVTERGADRRLAVTKETSFWRLGPAALKDVKAGMSISVLLTRDASGAADARRAVFASGPPGVILPL